MKRIFLIIAGAVFLTVFCPRVFAQEDEFAQLKERIDSQVYNASDDDAKALIEEENLKVGDSQSISGLSVRSLFSRLWDMFTDELGRPLLMLGKLLAVTVIFAAVRNTYNERSEMGSSFGIICMIAMIVMCSDILSQCLLGLSGSLESINTFMISYIPVFAAITTAGGNPVTAGVYTSSTMILCEAVELIAAKVLLPFISAVTALTIVCAVNPDLRSAGLADSIKKLTVWLLATVMILFTGILTLQGHAGSSADALASKTLRFAATSFIPVIGSSVSDAFTAARGAVGVIRSTLGGIGILIVVFTAARPLLLLISIRLALWCARAVNEILGLSDTSMLFRSLDSVLSIGMSVLIAVACAFIISTGAVISTASGGV